MKRLFGITLLLAASAWGQVPSATVKPAATNVQQVVSQIRPDKWKVSRQVHDSTAANVESVKRDITGTLSTLLTAADAAPNSLSSLLPLSRNLGALYDVLLRISVVSETSAPKQDADALAQALAALQQARHDIDDRVQTSATTEDQQAGDLRKQLATATAAAASQPAPAPCPPAKPAPRKKKSTHPAASPA